MNETEQALGATVTADLAEDETLPLLAVADIISHLPATSHHRRDRYGNEEFFSGFFSGPRQHRHRVAGTRNGRVDLSAYDIEALLRAAVDALSPSDTGRLSAALAYDIDNGAGTHRYSDDRYWDEEFFSGFWEGPRQHRSRLNLG
jgi:hypothetical protein